MKETRIPVRRKLFRLLESSGRGYRLGWVVDAGLIALILLNVLAIVMGSVESFAREHRDFLLGFELFSLAVFTLEYLARVWVAMEDPDFAHLGPVRGRLAYMARPLALIDLLAVAPSWAALLVGFDGGFLLLRLLRLLRVLKLTRYSPALESMFSVLKSESRTLFAVFNIVIVAVIGASALIHLVEHDAQPEAFGSIPQAMWWAMATMTTVGYGDVVPVTGPGKVIGGFVMLMGIGMFVLWTGVFASAFTEELRRREFRVSWEMVHRMPLFDPLDAAEVAEVTALMRPLLVPARHMILRVGEPSDSMFFIVSGEVEVEILPDPMRLGEGDFFGEVGLIWNTPRHASVIALSETRLLVLSRDAFDKVMARHPDVRATLSATADTRRAWLSPDRRAVPPADES